MYIQGIRYEYVESLHHKDILWRGQYCCLGYLFQLPKPDSASTLSSYRFKEKARAAA